MVYILSAAMADLSPGMHRLLPVHQNREIIVFIMNYELILTGIFDTRGWSTQ